MVMHQFRTLCIMYSVSQKSSPPKKKLFAIFLLKLGIFPWSVYPFILTNFGQFILIVNKMALIFLEVLLICAISSFEFQQVRLP